jgi:hypothetical protein
MKITQTWPTTWVVTEGDARVVIWKRAHNGAADGWTIFNGRLNTHELPNNTAWLDVLTTVMEMIDAQLQTRIHHQGRAQGLRT